MTAGSRMHSVTNASGSRACIGLVVWVPRDDLAAGEVRDLDRQVVGALRPGHRDVDASGNVSLSSLPRMTPWRSQRVFPASVPMHRQSTMASILGALAVPMPSKLPDGDAGTPVGPGGSSRRRCHVAR